MKFEPLPWYKFWNPDSGAKGGFIFGSILVICFWVLFIFATIANHD